MFKSKCYGLGYLYITNNITNGQKYTSIFNKDEYELC